MDVRGGRAAPEEVRGMARGWSDAGTYIIGRGSPSVT